MRPRNLIKTADEDEIEKFCPKRIRQHFSLSEMSNEKMLKSFGFISSTIPFTWILSKLQSDLFMINRLAEETACGS